MVRLSTWTLPEAARAVSALLSTHLQSPSGIWPKAAPANDVKHKNRSIWEEVVSDTRLWYQNFERNTRSRTTLSESVKFSLRDPGRDC